MRSPVKTFLTLTPSLQVLSAPLLTGRSVHRTRNLSERAAGNAHTAHANGLNRGDEVHRGGRTLANAMVARRRTATAVCQRPWERTRDCQRAVRGPGTVSDVLHFFTSGPRSQGYLARTLRIYIFHSCLESMSFLLQSRNSDHKFTMLGPVFNLF